MSRTAMAATGTAAATTAVLRAIPYFAPLDDVALRDLARHVTQRGHERGATIVVEGDRCAGLYFVVRGRVKVFKTSADGKEHVILILGPGRTFNDVPVFDDGTNPASVAALEPCTVGFVPRERVLALIERQPRVAVAVIRLLASRLRTLTLQIEDLAFRSVVARVARLLADCAQGRAAVLEGGEGACAHLTQQQIAAMTGTVREVVQRALKTLEREGAIRMQRARVAVLDVGALARWAEVPAAEASVTDVADGRGRRR